MTDITHAPLITLRYHVLTYRKHADALAAASGAPLPLQERVAVLDSAVTEAQAGGARLESHTATVAVLRYPKGPLNHAGQLLVTVLRLGLGLFSRAAAEQASRVMLTVDECGNITRWSLPH